MPVVSTGAIKAALPVGGRTILERQIDALRAAGIDDVVIVVGSWTLAPVSGAGHVPDVVEERSGLGGLYSALLMATTPVVVVLAGDMPFVRPSLLSRAGRLGAEADAVVPRVNGRLASAVCGLPSDGRGDRSRRDWTGATSRMSEALSDLRVLEVPTETIERLDPAGMTADEREHARRLRARRATRPRPRLVRSSCQT